MVAINKKSNLYVKGIEKVTQLASKNKKNYVSYQKAYKSYLNKYLKDRKDFLIQEAKHYKNNFCNVGLFDTLILIKKTSQDLHDDDRQSGQILFNLIMAQWINHRAKTMNQKKAREYYDLKDKLLLRTINIVANNPKFNACYKTRLGDNYNSIVFFDLPYTNEQVSFHTKEFLFNLGIPEKHNPWDKDKYCGFQRLELATKIFLVNSLQKEVDDEIQLN